MSSFHDAHMVLGEADNLMSRNICAVLFGRGLRDVAICRDASALHSALAPAIVDVLMFDASLPGVDLRETTQNIRHSRIGANPFAVIIATAEPRGSEGVQGALGAGIDDFLVRPMPADLVMRRINAFTRGRKLFAVTESYIGPDRRREMRLVEEAGELIEVPNTLRSKVVDGLGSDQVRRLVRDAKADVEERKVRSRYAAIVRLTRNILACYDGKGAEQELLRDLARLIERADDLVRNHRDTEYDHVAEIAGSIATLGRRIALTPLDPGKIELRLLANLADAVYQARTAADEATQVAREIAQAVFNYIAKHDAARGR